MWKCQKCNGYRFNSVKKCHCKKFKIVNEEGDEYEVHAMDENDAALKYAQESNETSDYYLMDSSVEITVNGKQFRISAEPDVHYSTYEL